MSDEPRDPGLEDLFSLAIETALASARTMLPGRVESYNALKQSASVTVLIKEAHVSEDDTRTVVALSQLHDVPVCHFGGEDGRITFPVKSGDVGMVVFASSSIARWKLIGGIVDPGDDRHHSLSDCFFVPGGHDFAHVPTIAPTDAIVTHGETRIGGPIGTEKMIRGETYRTAEDIMLGLLAAALTEIAAGLTALSQSSAATAAAATGIGTFLSTAATYLAVKGKVL